MKRLRHVRKGDLDDLLALAKMSAGGITSFPPDRELLAEKIATLSHFFALEDLSTGKVIGCSAVRTHMENSEASEVSTLFLHPDHRSGGLGRLLSYGRFLYIAINRAAFEPMIIARMRGLADHPVFGKPHPNTLPAVRMLEREGFAFQGEVDAGDLGPWLECATDELWTVKHLKSGLVRIVDQITGKPQVIAAQTDEFRACLSPIEENGEVSIPKEAAAALEVSDGDTIFYQEEAA